MSNCLGKESRGIEYGFFNFLLYYRLINIIDIFRERKYRVVGMYC